MKHSLEGLLDSFNKRPEYITRQLCLPCTSFWIILQYVTVFCGQQQCEGVPTKEEKQHFHSTVFFVQMTPSRHGRQSNHPPLPGLEFRWGPPTSSTQMTVFAGGEASELSCSSQRSSNSYWQVEKSASFPPVNSHVCLQCNWVGSWYSITPLYHFSY